MKGDFTRDTFDASKHFSRVLMQQGRVQLDSDWNEQAAIMLHFLRTLAADLIGPYAGPADDSFKIAKANDSQGNEIIHDFAVLNGHYYVDGILCENDLDSARYKNQANYPRGDDEKLDNGPALVYLDVWERHITALEYDYIREKALAGPDTTTRAQVVWQVKLWPATAQLGTKLKDPKDTTWKSLVDQWQPENRGRLKAMLKPLEGDTNPCITPPQSGFRGAENQLYRVEIHTGGGPDRATFKWSRDNGSAVAEWQDTQGDDLIVSSTRPFVGGQWVELIDDTRELRGERGTLVRLVKGENQTLTIDPKSTTESTDRLSNFVNPKVRRWDQQETGNVKLSAGDNAIAVQEGTAIELEDGIQIQFGKPAGAQNLYRTGDYWLIPARTATGGIEWPVLIDAQGKSIPASLPPHGIEHHYAPLWIIIVAGGSVTAADTDDLRRKVKPLWTL